MTYLFADCNRAELKVLIKGLESLNKLDETDQEYKDMCLGTLKFQLKDRYEQYD